MSQHTPIEYCDSTVNPTSGCDGCELYSPAKPGAAICYAKWLHEMKLAKAHPSKYGPQFNIVKPIPGRTMEAAGWKDLFGKPRDDKPWMNGWPRVIFISDMADAMSKAITFEYLREQIVVPVKSDQGKRHIWIWLTKQPQRMAAFSRWLNGWPPNLWAGTSITSHSTLARIRALKEVGDEHTTRYLSAEPILEPFSILPTMRNSPGGIHWVIAGGSSGKNANDSDVDMWREWRRDCEAMQIPYFLKQLGSRATSRGLGDLQLPVEVSGKGGDWDEWPESLRVRQMPVDRVGVSIPGHIGMFGA